MAPRHFKPCPGRRVRDDLWEQAAEAAMGHIELARWADVVVIAPATADFWRRSPRASQAIFSHVVSRDDGAASSSRRR